MIFVKFTGKKPQRPARELMINKIKIFMETCSDNQLKYFDKVIQAVTCDPEFRKLYQPVSKSVASSTMLPVPED